MEKKLLTIGIPTYNRANALDNSLHHLLPQLKPFADLIYLVVSDNASTQNNKVVVDKYIAQGYDIDFIRQDNNLGMDGNFSFLYEKANSKYVWLLSDDDIVVKNGFNRIIKFLLSEREVGTLYLSNIWFNSEKDFPSLNIDEPTSIIIYENPLLYFKRVNYWITFLSANIVNKDALNDKIDISKFQGTHLALLSWIIPAAFQNLPNAFLENQILACKGGDQGGYKFIEVFAVKFNEILDYFISKGYPKDIKSDVNYNLLKHYFPYFVLAKRENNLVSSSYKKESWFKTLFYSYYGNYNFYKYVIPSFFLSSSNYKRWADIIK